MYVCFCIIKCVNLCTAMQYTLLSFHLNMLTIFIISSYCCQTLTDLKRFQDLVKELTICACRNYLSPATQPGNSGVYIVIAWAR